MNVFLNSVFLVLITLLPVAAYGGEIQGRVRNAQGVAVSGAKVTVTNQRNGAHWEVATGEDGVYSVAGLESGFYRVTVTAASGQQALRREVSVGQGSSTARADFQFAQAPTQPLSGAEERNPNIFITRIDFNDLRNRLRQFGPKPQYIPELRPEQNYVGAELGTPIRAFEGVRPRSLLSQWRGTLLALHQNSALNARNFFNVGPLLPSRVNAYGITAGGPVISQKVSLLLDFGQTLTSGFVNGNVQVPLAEERTPLAADPQVRAVIAALLKAYPADLPNLPSVSKRQLNSNASRDIDATDGLARLDWKVNNQTAAAFRYFVNQYSEDPFQIILGQNPRTDLRSQGLHTNVTRSFSPTTVGRFGFHYDRNRADLNVTQQYSSLFSSLGLPIVPDVIIRGGSLSGMGPGKLFPSIAGNEPFSTLCGRDEEHGTAYLDSGLGDRERAGE